MALPVIESIIQALQSKQIENLECTVFVCVQHLLYTSINIFEALIRLGANPRNIFLLGKQYSTCTNVVNEATSLGIQVQPLTPLTLLGEYESVFIQDLRCMWEKVRQHVKSPMYRINTLVVLDDGGRCLHSIPTDLPKNIYIIGVEQTTAGIVHLNDLNFKYNYIDVATSVAKTLEADMVANVIFEKMTKQLPTFERNVTCGVVGLGSIGMAVARKLASLVDYLYLYDCNPEKFLTITKNDTDLVLSKQKIEWTTDLKKLIENSSYIFGCTGFDFTQQLCMEEIIKNDKHFISCSSEDKEFLSILKYIQQRVPNGYYNPLGNIEYQFKKDITIHIVKGGFPCNFDNSGTSVEENNIQLTRGLILVGLLQAMFSLSSYKRNGITGRIMLDPNVQKFIVLKWKNFSCSDERKVISEEKFNNFMDLSWIISKSGGVFHYLPDFYANFDINQGE